MDTHNSSYQCSQLQESECIFLFFSFVVIVKSCCDDVYKALFTRL